MPQAAEDLVTVAVGPWPRGLNNWADPEDLQPTELVAADDVEIASSGRVKVRQAVRSGHNDLYSWMAPAQLEAVQYTVPNSTVMYGLLGGWYSAATVSNSAVAFDVLENPDGTRASTGNVYVLCPVEINPDAPDYSEPGLELVGSASLSAGTAGLGLMLPHSTVDPRKGVFDQPLPPINDRDPASVVSVFGGSRNAVYAARQGVVLMWGHNALFSQTAPVRFGQSTLWTVEETWGDGEGDGAVQIGEVGDVPDPKLKWNTTAPVEAGWIPPSDCLALFAHGASTWLVSGRRNEVRYSYPQTGDSEVGYQNWNEQFVVKLPLDGTDRITAMVQYRDTFLVFTLKTVWRLHGENPLSWYHELVSENIGVENSGVVRRSPYGVLFIDSRTKRLWRFGAEGLEDLWHGRINPGAVTYSQLSYAHDRAWVTVNSFSPNLDGDNWTYVHNFRTGSISRMRFGASWVGEMPLQVYSASNDNVFPVKGMLMLGAPGKLSVVDGSALPVFEDQPSVLARQVAAYPVLDADTYQSDRPSYVLPDEVDLRGGDVDGVTVPRVDTWRSSANPAAYVRTGLVPSMVTGFVRPELPDMLARWQDTMVQGFELQRTVNSEDVYGVEGIPGPGGATARFPLAPFGNFQWVVSSSGFEERRLALGLQLGTSEVQHIMRGLGSEVVRIVFRYRPATRSY